MAARFAIIGRAIPAAASPALRSSRPRPTHRKRDRVFALEFLFLSPVRAAAVSITPSAVHRSLAGLSRRLLSRLPLACELLRFGYRTAPMGARVLINGT